MSTNFLLNSSIYKEKIQSLGDLTQGKKKVGGFDDGMIVPQFVYNFVSSDMQKTFIT